MTWYNRQLVYTVSHTHQPELLGFAECPYYNARHYDTRSHYTVDNTTLLISALAAIGFITSCTSTHNTAASPVHSIAGVFNSWEQ